MLSADLSSKKCENIFSCSPSLSLVVYNFSENTSRKYPFMVCFGWIHAYVGTDLVCLWVCVCVCLCVEALQPLNKIRIIELMDSMTAAFFMCQAQLQQSPIQDATTTKRQGKPVEYLLWSIRQYAH